MLESMTLRPRARVYPGGQIDRFRIESRLGQGASGTVFAAYDTRDRAPVALKVMRGDVDPYHRRRFLREARLAAAVRHENIAQVFDILEVSGQLLIVMELVRGETLRARLKDAAARGARLPREEALRIARRAARGLCAAHRAGIIHRDVKPGNLMIGHDGEVKLLDFGIAKPGLDADLQLTSLDGRAGNPLTGDGAVLGTPGYMAPEQARGEPVDARADVFSMGVILYEMLAGKKPFTGECEFDVLLAIEEVEPPPPSLTLEVTDHVDHQLDRVVSRCMHKTPGERYASAAGLLRELHAISQLAMIYRAKGRVTRESP